MPVHGDDGILIRDGNTGLTRLDIAAVSPMKTVVVDYNTDGNVCSMAVNATYDALALMRNADNMQKTIRVYKDAGGFDNNSASEGHCLTAGPASDPDGLFYTQLTDQVTFDYSLFRVAKGDDGKYAAKVEVTDLKDAGADFPCSGVVRTADKVYAVFARQDGGGSAHGYFTELVNAEKKPKLFELTDLKRLEKIYGFDASLILLGADEAGNSSLKRFTSASETFEDLVRPGDYVVTQVGVSPSGP